MTEEIEPANFAEDLEAVLGSLMKESDDVCVEVWSAMANVDWYHPATHTSASYSFRAAGRLIADIIGKGNYLNWYCSGPYATVSERVARRMKKMGWIADPLPPICDQPDCYEDAGIFSFKDGKQIARCHEHDEYLKSIVKELKSKK